MRILVAISLGLLCWLALAPRTLRGESHEEKAPVAPKQIDGDEPGNSHGLLDVARTPASVARAIATLSETDLRALVKAVRQEASAVESLSFYGQGGVAYGDSWVMASTTLLEVTRSKLLDVLGEQPPGVHEMFAPLTESEARKLAEASTTVVRLPSVPVPLGGTGHAVFGGDVPIQFNWEDEGATSSAKPVSARFFRGFRCTVQAPESVPGMIRVQGYWSDIERLFPHMIELKDSKRKAHLLHSGTLKFGGDVEWKGEQQIFIAGARQPWRATVPILASNQEDHARIAVIRLQAVSDKDLPAPTEPTDD